MELVTFTELAGVPVHYDRLSPPFQYGSRGKPLSFKATPKFKQKLDSCFSEIWRVLGNAEVITTAGAYVHKPGMHGKGRAFDLDGIFWKDKQLVTARFHEYPKLYLSVEAILRRHFGTVLNYFYNPAHRDHFHFDDGSPVGFTASSPSRTLFVRACLRYLWNVPVAMRPGWNISLERKIPKDVPDLWAWQKFLYAVAEAAAADYSSPGPEEDEPKEKTPLQLLHNLYSVIEDELQGTALRKPVEIALNEFCNHEATQKWLEQFREGDEEND